LTESEFSENSNDNRSKFTEYLFRVNVASFVSNYLLFSSNLWRNSGKDYMQSFYCKRFTETFPQ